MINIKQKGMANQITLKLGTIKLVLKVTSIILKGDTK